MDAGRHQAAKNAVIMRGFIKSEGWAMVEAGIRKEMAALTQRVMDDESTAPEERESLIQRYRAFKTAADSPRSILAGSESTMEDAADQIEETDNLA